MRMPRLTIAVTLFVLAALAGTLTYTGFLVVGVLAHHLDISRFFAGLLLGVLFARVPWLIAGKLRTVGLLPKFLRRPVTLGLLALGLSHFLAQGDNVSAAFMGLTAAFLLAFPWLKRAVWGRTVGSFFPFPGKRTPPARNDGSVIDVQFTEKKD